jgi:hypothetical protein
MKALTTGQKEQLSGKEMICPTCTRKTSGLDHCEWCGTTLLNNSSQENMEVNKLVNKEEVKEKTRETLQEILPGQRPQKQKKVKRP